jgi:conjugative relaxase-like TrwC/TraI family protein
MLSIGKVKGNTGYAYYTEGAREDYYTQGGEPPGVWYGEGLENLGLTKGSRIDESDFGTVYQGFNLDKNQPQALVQNAGDQKRTNAWDLTFSAPKSVSTLWSQSDERTRKIIIDSVHESARITLDMAQELCGHTRRGKHGESIEKGKLVFGLFEHVTNRNLEPQIHVHSVLMNAAFREDGTSGTLETTSLYDHKLALGYGFQLTLSHLLKERLSVNIRVAKHSFEVQNVSEVVMDVFSSRNKEIREQMEAEGVSGAKAAERVAKETRNAKVAHIPRENLFEQWQWVGTQFGWGPHEARKAINQRPSKIGAEAPFEHVVATQFAKLVDDKTIVTERDLFVATARQGVAYGITVQEAWEYVRKELDSERVQRVGQTPRDTFYSRTDLVNAEKTAAKLLDTMSSTKRHILSNRIVSKGLSQNQHLTDEQQSAIKILTQSQGNIATLSGIAGAGKSMVLKPTAEMYAQAGYQVIGLAPTNKVAKALEESTGMKCYTLDKFLSKSDVYQTDPSKTKVRWKLPNELWKQVEGKIPNRKISNYSKVLTIGRIQLQVQKYESLKDLDRGFLKNNRLGKALMGDSVGRLRFIKVSLAKRKQKQPERYLAKTMFNIGAVKFEIWKTQTNLPKLNPLGWIDFPFFQIRLRGDDKKTFGANTVLFVDEAGMVDTKKQAALLEKAAATGMKVILSGDGKHRQIQPIQAGSLTSKILEKVPGAELTQIFRQKDPEDQRMVYDLAAGNHDAVIENLIKRQRYHEGDGQTETAQKLMNLWAERFATVPEKTAIIATTNKLCSHFNQAAQKIRSEMNLLGPEKVPIKDGEVRVGDRVIFTRTSRKHDVNNGTLGTLTKIKGSEVKIRTDDGQDVRLSVREYRGLALGYAFTTHKAQGMTMDNGLVLAGPNWINQELTYVQLSRFRNETHLFCSSTVSGLDQNKLINEMAKTQVKETTADAMADQQVKYEKRSARFETDKETARKQKKQNEQEAEHHRQKMKMKHTM